MFDIFISYKHTVDGVETRDYTIASELYEKLTQLGYECFFSARTLANLGKANYSAVIDEALEQAKILVLVATTLDYIKSDYVAFEWSSFAEEIKIGNKPGGKIFTYLENIDVHKLPMSIKHTQNCKIGLEDDLLIEFITSAIEPSSPKNKQANAPQFGSDKDQENNDDSVYSRTEIVDLLIQKIHKYKYPYLIYSKVNTPEKVASYLVHAKAMFSETVTGYYRGDVLESVDDMIETIVDEMSCGDDSYIRVEGLPGSAKNMILQLAFYQMLDNFKSGKSDHLPFYISSSYYEKLKYDPSNVRDDMKRVLSEVFYEYFKFLRENPDVKPVLFVEAIREHKVSKFAPEDVISELWRPLGKFNRICAIDVGLIKNKARHKRTIALELNTNGYVYVTKQVPIDDSAAAIRLINSIFNMYSDEYSYIDAVDTYNRLKEFQFPTIDIFLVRLIATGYMGRRLRSNTEITDVYEGMAFDDIKNFSDGRSDEDSLRYVAEELNKYVFETSLSSFNDGHYNAVLWSLPHKHSTYLEFLIAYYFIYRVEHYKEYPDQSFFSIMHTSMSNHFVAAYLKDDFERQALLLEFISKNYSEFNIQQKSNATYWLGRITVGALKKEAIVLLTREFANLKKDVEFDNKTTIENCNNHFLFRSICNGLHAQNQANMMDEYLRIVVSNDVANAINRGATIEYFSENYSMLSHDKYNLDTDLSVGEQSIKILLSRIETALDGRSGKFVEIDLVTVLSLLQARIQNVRSEVKFNVKPYVKKALEYLERYHSSIPNVSSSELIDYFKSVEDDLNLYMRDGAFDIGPMIYERYRGLKQVKRSQWLEHNIVDPESIAEHSFSAWMLAMFFLPEEMEDATYSKREILDMLLVHDMAEADTGDKETSLSESTKELGEQNIILKKLFLKGTYPDIANLTYYYRVWTNYYKGTSSNAKTARDINLLQSVYTFCEYYCQFPEQFTAFDVREWLLEKHNLTTMIGHELFDRLILNNHEFQPIVVLAKIK